ncbi:MAG TPA: hypothetical protein PL182_13025, partial [Pseudobdellovibrionaceae bacterium]|nr:hypothetical protein [Pseudobdellovibrionaceae bacterium]
MSKILHDLKVDIDEDLNERLAWMVPGNNGHRLLRQSVDARQRTRPHFVMTVEVAEAGETLQT